MENEMEYVFASSAENCFTSVWTRRDWDAEVFLSDGDWEIGGFGWFMHLLVKQFPEYVPLMQNTSKDVCFKMKHVLSLMPELRKTVLAEIEKYFADPPPYKYEKFLLLGYPIALGDPFIRGRGMVLKELKRLLEFLDYAISHEESCWLRFYQGFDFGMVRLLLRELGESNVENLKEPLNDYCNSRQLNPDEMIDLLLRNGLMRKDKRGFLLFSDRGKMF